MRNIIQLLGIDWVMPGWLQTYFVVGTVGLGNIIPIFETWYLAV